MKKLLLVFTLIIMCHVSFSTETKTDTLARKLDTAVTVIKADVKGLKTSVDSIKSKASDTTKKECNCIALTAEQREKNWETIGCFGIFLSLIPLIAFLLLGTVVVIKLWKFPIDEALSESTIEKVTMLNPQYTAGTIISSIQNPTSSPAAMANLSTIFPPTIEVSNMPAAPPPAGAPKPYRPSSSRLIAFISSLFSIIIVLSMSCFYIFNYLYTGCPPKLTALTEVLVTLGIGVLPYGANKIAAAVKANKDSANNQ